MDENMGLIHLGTWVLENCVLKQKILAKMLVFMGSFGVWAQVWSKGSCVGKAGSQVRFQSPALFKAEIIRLFYCPSE